MSIPIKPILSAIESTISILYGVSQTIAPVVLKVGSVALNALSFVFQGLGALGRRLFRHVEGEGDPVFGVSDLLHRIESIAGHHFDGEHEPLAEVDESEFFEAQLPDDQPASFYIEQYARHSQILLEELTQNKGMTPRAWTAALNFKRATKVLLERFGPSLSRQKRARIGRGLTQLNERVHLELKRRLKILESRVDYFLDDEVDLGDTADVLLKHIGSFMLMVDYAADEEQKKALLLRCEKLRDRLSR